MPHIVMSNEPVVATRYEQLCAERYGWPGDKVFLSRIVRHIGCLMGLFVSATVYPRPTSVLAVQPTGDEGSGPGGHELGDI